MTSNQYKTQEAFFDIRPSNNALGFLYAFEE